ncbi:hypothetical protein HC928_14725 [bacterium]|nr:hypothetical protein [bacterium]
MVNDPGNDVDALDEIVIVPATEAHAAAIGLLWEQLVAIITAWIHACRVLRREAERSMPSGWWIDWMTPIPPPLSPSIMNR